jgi:hypothetical protein
MYKLFIVTVLHALHYLKAVSFPISAFLIFLHKLLKDDRQNTTGKCQLGLRQHSGNVISQWMMKITYTL